MDSPIASSTSQDTLHHSANTLRLFVDTEFTDFANCDLISIGLVSSQGHVFYGENLDFDRSKSSQFAKDNINSVKAVFFEGFTEYFNSNPSATRHHARDDAAANAHG